MKIAGIIPSRYASTRFPGKPLTDISGKTMIQRVYEQAKKAKSLSDVIVATDDERIQKCVLDFGGKVAMTSSEHKSGTDRCAEVVEKFYDDFDAAINIQGDEPHIHPEQIDEVAKCFAEKTVQLATLVKVIESPEDVFNPNRIKVVIDKNQNAIYFSRNPIPWSPDLPAFNLPSHLLAQKPTGLLPSVFHLPSSVIFYKHIGIYGYRISTLKEITKLKQSSLEITESLEQLRWIENGYKIKTRITKLESVSIDSPEDLKKLINLATE